MKPFESHRIESHRGRSRPFEAIEAIRGHLRPFSSRIRGHSRPFKDIRVKRISHRGHSRPFGTFFGPGKSTKKSVIESHRGHSRPFEAIPIEAIRGHSRPFERFFLPALLSKKISHRVSSRLIERFFGHSRDFVCLTFCHNFGEKNDKKTTKILTAQKLPESHPKIWLLKILAQNGRPLAGPR